MNRGMETALGFPGNGTAHAGLCSSIHDSWNEPLPGRVTHGSLACLSLLDSLSISSEHLCPPSHLGVMVTFLSRGRPPSSYPAVPDVRIARSWDKLPPAVCWVSALL